jgi:pimeloyl-ACP methyl ester carboxylesterase
MKRTTKLMVEIAQQKIELSVHIDGKGPSILCLHGLMHSSEIWNRVSGLLIDDFQIITLDLPGFGASPPLPLDYISLANYGQIVGAAIDALSRQNEIAAIVADSLSTSIVASACEHGLCPARSRMLLSGCTFDGIPMLLRVLPVSFLIKPTLYLFKALPISWSRLIINLFVRYTVHNLADVGDEISTGVLSTDPATAKKMFNALKRPTPSQTVHGLAQHKCILLRGRFDRVVSRSSLSGWARKIDATYVELSNSGHTPAIEEPAKYAESIRNLVC